MGTYTIGQIAERSGFSASTLRYYEGIGLVAPSGRTEAGYRLYDDRSLARLDFIARAKQLGCSLEEITDLVEIWDGQRCGPVQQRFHRLVTEKIVDARRKVDEITALTRQLRDAATQLAGPAVDGPCGPGCACLRDGDGGEDGGGDGATPSGVPVALTTNGDPPIACTLGADDLGGRLQEWRELLALATDRRPTADGGLLIAFDPAVDIAALARLVAAEQRCCAFLAFTITVGPEGVALEVRAPESAGAIVRDLFGAVGS